MFRVHISLKIYLIIFLVSIFFIGVMVFSGFGLVDQIYASRYGTPKAAVDIGYGVLQNYYDQAEAGSLSTEEAQSMAMGVIKSLRYEGGNEYFWLNDTTLPYPSMVMHPIKPALDGQLLDSQSYNVAFGKKQNLFQAFVEICLRDGEGYVDYLWPKPGQEEPVPKISYVKLFKDWGWIIGTGVYIDKIEDQVASILVPVAVSTILLFIIISGITFLVISSTIVKPMRRMVELLKSLSEGDLTKRLHIKNNDEIGDMIDYFNKSLDSLKNFLHAIKDKSDGLSRQGMELSSNMNQTAAAINQIIANIQSIKAQIFNQSASVIETNSAMEQISMNIGKLNERVDRQSASVTESSSAIEQMLANIASVSQTLTKNSENVHELAIASDAGRADLTVVSAGIREVARESEGLMEISTVIQQIAGQTNLLSMNAAIEAAHAGESGRGFAVVADEIRKLAESSKAQSGTISSSLARIQVAMERISRDTDTVLVKFEDIDVRIKAVSEREAAMQNAMQEQEIASKEIFRVIGELNEITTSVMSGTGEMLTGSQEVINESRNLGRITEELTGNMAEMANGAQEITIAVNNVNDISQQNKESIDALMEEISKFII